MNSCFLLLTLQYVFCAAFNKNGEPKPDLIKTRHLRFYNAHAVPTSYLIPQSQLVIPLRSYPAQHPEFEMAVQGLVRNRDRTQLFPLYRPYLRQPQPFLQDLSVVPLVREPRPMLRSSILDENQPLFRRLYGGYGVGSGYGGHGAGHGAGTNVHFFG